MRINYFEQIKAFYSFVYNTDHEVRTTHHALYNFLLNQNNRSNWVEWFKCPFDLAMQGASINSKNTYYKTLDDLVSFGLIEYKKGINLHKAPQIKIIILSSVSKNGSVNVPLSDTLTLPLNATQPLQVSEQLNDNIIRQETIDFNKPLDNILLEKESKEDISKFNFKNSLLDLGFKKELVIEWLQVRKAKKATNTETALKGFMSEVKKSGRSPDEILTICIENSWKGFKAEWITNLNQNQNGKPKYTSNVVNGSDRLAEAKRRILEADNIQYGGQRHDDFEDADYSDV